MTAPEKQKYLRETIYKLKRASGFAEAMSASPVSVETCSTLHTLTTEAMAAVVSLRSIAAGNQEPKRGGM